MMESVKNILFDLDNTLLDFDYASEQAFDVLMQYFKVPELLSEYSLYHEINHQVWSRLERREISQIEVRTLRWKLFWEATGKDFDPASSNQLYLNFLADNGRWIDGARELFDELLNRDFDVFIVTNGFKEVQRKRLVKENILDSCVDVVISDEIGFSKPDPRFFDHLFNRNPQLKKEECLVVGDSLNSDINGGENYGVKTCWFNPSGKPNHSEINPTFEIRTMENLRNQLGFS